MVPRFCVAIKQNAFKLKRARWIFTINITDGRVVKMSSQMDAALSVFYFCRTSDGPKVSCQFRDPPVFVLL